MKPADLVLTDKQVKFVHEYLIDFNAAGAAKRAGYAPKHAAKTAYDLLRTPHVAAHLAARQRAALAKCEVSKADVIDRYRDLAFVNMRDAFDVSTGQMRTLGECDEAFCRAIEAIEVDAAGRIRKLRFSDRLHALDSLAKHLGITEPAHEPTLAVGSVTQVNVTEVYLDRLSTAQLDELDRLLEAAGLEGAPNGPRPPLALEQVTDAEVPA